MPERMTRTWLLLAVAFTFAVVAVWGQAPQKNWKDRAEYDLYDAAAKAAKASDNNKAIEVLTTWQQKYPASDYNPERLLMLLNAYDGLHNVEKVMETGNQILALDSKSLPALFIMTRNTVAIAKPTPELLSSAEKAASSLVANIDALKPANTPDAEWNKGKPDILALGHLALGWIHMQRKQNDAAEKEFTASLQANANNAQVSYWLATVIRAQQNPDKSSAAIYQFIRAGFYSGPGAFPDANRKDVAAYATKLYNTFHGSNEGFAELQKQAVATAVPAQYPAIKSSGELKLMEEEEFKKATPMLALWKTVKGELTGSSGASYFDSGVKGALLPGGASGVSKFKAKLVACKPAKNPKELVLSIEDPNGDVTLVMAEDPLPGTAPAGTELEFEGVPTAYSTSPFMLTFEVDQNENQLVGWPVKAPPAKKDGGATKKGAAPAKPAATPAKPAATPAAKPPAKKQ